MDENVKFIEDCMNKILGGTDITREEAGKLNEAGKKEPLFLMAAADKIRKTFCGDKMRFCSDVNAEADGARKTADSAPSPAGTIPA